MPKMVELYQGLLQGSDAKLPLITRIMIGGSDFLISWWGIGTIILVLVLLLYFWRWSRTPVGSDALKSAALRLPVFGPFFRNYLRRPDASHTGDARERHSVNDRAFPGCGRDGH
jgi:Type II secretory pathway, component PulF